MVLPPLRVAAVYCLLLAVGFCLSQSLTADNYGFTGWDEYKPAAKCLTDAANANRCYIGGTQKVDGPNYDGCLCGNTLFLDDAIVCFDVYSTISSAFGRMNTNCHASGNDLPRGYDYEDNWNSIASAERTSSTFQSTPTTPFTSSSTTKATSAFSGSATTTKFTTYKTSATGSTTIFPGGTVTPEPTDNPEPGGMSTGAKAGLGVGVGLGALALLGALLWFFLKKLRSGNNAGHALSNSAVMSSDIISTVAPSSQHYRQGPA